LIDIPPCSICGQQFDNIFDAVDHLVDDKDEEEFNPIISLPSGYQLLFGSLLRQLYEKADNPEEVKTIVELTYATLYAADTDIPMMKKLVEDAIIHEYMFEIEKELKELLEEDK
jgi:hypothetical protein